MDELSTGEKALAVICVGIGFGIMWAALDILGVKLPRPRPLATVTPIRSEHDADAS